MYEDRNCEYCGEQFAKNDDIVVCPDCGAPYHRKCWSEHGSCAHREEHANGYVYGKSADSEQQENEDAQADEDFIETLIDEVMTQKQEGSAASDKKHCERCGAELIDGCDYCVLCSHRRGNPYTRKAKDNSGKSPYGTLKATDTIAGQPVKDVALLVRNNADKLLPRLKKTDARKLRVGWSWLAFIFGYLYLFFRKLYRYGLIVILAEVMLFNGLNLAMGDPIGKTTQVVNGIYAEYGTELSGSALTQEQYEQFITQANKELLESGLIGKIYAVLGVSLLVSNTACALLFDFLYLKHCSQTVERIKRSAEILGDMSEQDYQLNLLTRGGVGIFGLVLGYFSWLMIGQIVAYLLELSASLFG